MPNYTTEMDSQQNIGKQGLVAENSTNNSWLYNGNNGKLNNNNKNNTNSVRPVLDFNPSEDTTGVSECVIPLQDWYDIYRRCRRGKAGKPSHLVFLYDFARTLTAAGVQLLQRSAVMVQRLACAPWRVRAFEVERVAQGL